MLRDTLQITGDLELRHEMACESDPKKRRILKDAFPDIKHLFSEVNHMGRKTTWCHIHEKNVPIPGDLDILFAGFSCKGINSYNVHHKFATLWKSSSTGSTLRGVRSYIGMHSPKYVVLENVRTLLMRHQSGKCMADLIVEFMRKMGYVGTYIEANANDYFLPQSRNRVWFSSSGQAPRTPTSKGH